MLFDPALNLRSYREGSLVSTGTIMHMFLNNNDVTSQGEDESIRLFRDAEKKAV